MAKNRDDDAAGGVLRMLSTLGPTQGYDVVERLVKSACSTHAEGYSELYRLESRGLIEGRIEPSADGGERRWYSLTPLGVRAVAADSRLGQPVALNMPLNAGATL